MKLFATTLLLSSFSVMASCPIFSPLYIQCQATALDYSVDTIRVSNRNEFYKFKFEGKSRSWRINVVADGSPRDVTIQTQDGSEHTYSETASCSKESLSVIRTTEESKVKEETLFITSDTGINIFYLIDGALKNQTKCTASISQSL